MTRRRARTGIAFIGLLGVALLTASGAVSAPPNDAIEKALTGTLKLPEVVANRAPAKARLRR